MKTKTCTSCHLELPMDNFYPRNTKPGYMNPKCKSCQKIYHKEWYAKNSENVRKRTAAGRPAIRKKMKDFLAKVKSGPCTDCGRKFPPCAMDFDHLDSTTKVPKVIGFATEEAMLLEIAKCELVCACCHRIRTQNRKLAFSVR